MIRRWARKMVEFIYPPLCLHCQEPVGEDRLFCRGCSGFFELIDPSQRCIFCFAEQIGSAPCPECIRKKRWHMRLASALDYLGGVTALVKGLKYGRMPYLARTASAFMATQFFRLKWPYPDLIIPVPRREWFRGGNHAELIARSLAARLEIPCAPLIKREAGDFSQARLDMKQREQLTSARFSLRKNTALQDQIILLVDDVLTTGTTLLCCADLLSMALPKQIYGLTLARTMI